MLDCCVVVYKQIVASIKTVEIMADGPFICYRELVPCTAVIQSTFFQNFSNATGRCEDYLCTLVVGGINIYKVCRDDGGDTFLSLICNKRLFGKPNNVGTLRNPGEKDDMLVLSLDSAKTIVVKCNIEHNEYETILLCNCEENSVGTGSELQVQLNGVRRHLGLGNEAKVSVCAESSMFCSTVYGQFLVLMPLPGEQNMLNKKNRKDLSRIVSEDNIDDMFSAQDGFSVDINSVLGLPGPIIDTCFLSGYSRPVLLVLQQSGLLPIGHAARVRHCCTVTALTVSAESKALAVLWQRTHLPYDAVRLVPLTHAAYVGSVCVICMNAVLVLNQEEAQGVAVNGFAAVTVRQDQSTGDKAIGYGTTVGSKCGGIGLQSWVAQEEGLELDASCWIEQTACSQALNEEIARSGSSVTQETGAAQSRHSIVGALKNGTILRVTMIMSTPGMISSILFTPEVVAASISASCFSASLTGDLWFLGSRQGSSLLMAVDRVAVVMPRIVGGTLRNMDHTSAFLSPATKRQRSASVVSDEDGENDNALRRLHENSSSTPHASPMSKMNASSDPVNDPSLLGQMDENAEEMALYGGSLREESSDALEGAARASMRTSQIPSGDRLELSVVDSFPVLGSVLAGLCTKQDALFDGADSVSWERLHEPEYRSNVKSTAASYIAERDAKDGVLLASGLDEEGALLRVYNGLHLTKIVTRNLPGAARIFSLASAQYSVLLVVYDDKTRILHCTESSVAEPHSSSNSSSNLHSNSSVKDSAELQFKELSSAECGLICTSKTLNFGFVQPENSNELISAQVTPQGVRLVRLGACYGAEGEPMQDVLVADSLEMGGLGGDATESILTGDICPGYIVVLTSTHSVHLMRYDLAEESVEIVCSLNGQNMKLSGDADMQIDGKVAVTLDDLLSSRVVSVSLFFGVLRESTARFVGKSTQVTSNDNDDAEAGRATHIIEETYLYGAALPCDDENVSNGCLPADEGETNEAAQPRKGSRGKVPKSKSQSSNNRSAPVSRSAESKSEHSFPDVSEDSMACPPEANLPQAYLIVTELNGNLSIIRLSTMQTMFQSKAFSSLVECALPFGSNDARSCHQEVLITETCLMRLTDPIFPEEEGRTRLCLALLLSSGDLVTYGGVESHGTLAAFHKIDQISVVNRRAPDGGRLARSFAEKSTSDESKHETVATDAASSSIATAASMELEEFLSSAEYTERMGPCMSTVSYATGGRSGILVAGNDAQMVTCVHGLPSVIPLGFPELPFINYGQHSLVSFQVGTVNAVAALWFEWEDLETLKNPSAAAANKATRASTLGLYQQVDGLELYPASSVSVKRVHVGRTVHRVDEILNKTDDRTQQALLDKKTFLIACSEETKQPFLPSVLTDEELQEDSELYERYYTSLESFCQPDTTVGLAPTISARTHTLALLQGTSVVDTYTLPLNECVIDTEILYLTLEKFITMPGSMLPLKFTERRVFIAACTSIIEKRGEDTQGNGRLLLFALDYALFEKDEEEVEQGGGDVSSSTIGDATATAQSELDALTAAAKAIVSSADSNKTAGGATLSAAQAKFLDAIKPKLRLLWTGPGPASVVRQLGEYVLSTVASTVYVYKFNTATMDLEQVAFYFTQLYVTSVTILKHYILLGDMHHSVQLLYWREADHALLPISKDYDPTVPLCTEFLYDGPKLGMMMTDDEGNLQLFQENPRKVESNQGSRLLNLADFHIGSDASLLLRHDLLSTDPVKKTMPNPLDLRPPPPPPRSRKGSNFPLQRYGTRFNKATFPARATVLLGTIDGALAVVQPLEERMYRRLALLQQIMTMTVHTNFSLNPGEYRLLKSAHLHVNRKKGVLDGCLLSMFCTLPPSLQNKLAATVGATAYLIKENLHELDYLCRYF